MLDYNLFSKHLATRLPSPGQNNRFVKQIEEGGGYAYLEADALLRLGEQQLGRLAWD